MDRLKNGELSEPTLCRVENGIGEFGFADRMAAFSMIFNKELVKACDKMEIIFCIDSNAMCGTVRGNRVRGRIPDIIFANSPSTGITLATEVCREKSNEIKAAPLLIDKIDVAGKLVTADAMSMQRDIIGQIKKGWVLNIYPTQNESGNGIM